MVLTYLLLVSNVVRTQKFNSNFQGIKKLSLSKINTFILYLMQSLFSFPRPENSSKNKVCTCVFSFTLLSSPSTIMIMKMKVLGARSCSTLYDPMDCSPAGSSVHGVLQARILGWVATSFSRGSSQPRDWTIKPGSLILQSGSLPSEPLWKPCLNHDYNIYIAYVNIYICQYTYSDIYMYMSFNHWSYLLNFTGCQCLLPWVCKCSNTISLSLWFLFFWRDICGFFTCISCPAADLTGMETRLCWLWLLTLTPQTWLLAGNVHLRVFSMKPCAGTVLLRQLWFTTC